MESLKRVLLASESPRRREMMTWLDVPLQITRTDVDENPHNNEKPRDLASRLAIAKARALNPGNEAVWVLAADTIVDCENTTLGKPADAVEARAMLQQLREGVHQVHTGITLAHPVTAVLSARYVTTSVWMRPYTDDEIDTYIAGGDTMDKAGAYAVQHEGFHPVQRLDRCFANVVGLPLCAVAHLLKTAGFGMSVDIPNLCLMHFGYHCPKPDKGTQV